MNSVNITGRFLRTPMLQESANNRFCRFILAVDRKMSRLDKEIAQDKGEPITDFITCIAFSGYADIICNNFIQGESIGITGSIQSFEIEREGKKITGMNVFVKDIDFLVPLDIKKRQRKCLTDS